METVLSALFFFLLEQAEAPFSVYANSRHGRRIPKPTLPRVRGIWLN